MCKLCLVQISSGLLDILCVWIINLHSMLCTSFLRSNAKEEEEGGRKEKKKKKKKGLRISNLALLLVVFKRHRDSEGVKQEGAARRLRSTFLFAVTGRNRNKENKLIRHSSPQRQWVFSCLGFDRKQDVDKKTGKLGLLWNLMSAISSVEGADATKRCSLHQSWPQTQ